MNKLTKGSLAAGAGLVLLLGGAGTFMSWNDQETIAGGPVTAGQLKVAPVASSWTVNDESVSDITAYPIVPCDTVVYTTDLDVTAEGENLTASLTLDESAITASTPGTAADDALALELRDDAQLDVTSTTGLITDPDGDGVYTLDAGTDPVTETVTATVTLEFPSASATEGSMNGSVNLADMNVSFTQNINPAPAA